MAITLTGSDSGISGGDTTTLDLSLTVASDDDMIICGAATGASDDAIVSSVVIDPGGADEASFSQDAAAENGTDCAGEIWHLLGASIPPAGTYTVRITWSASTFPLGYVQAGNGFAQQAAEVINTSTGALSSFSTSVTTLTDGALIFDAAGSRDAEAGVTANAGQTVLLNQAGFGSGSYGMGSHESKATAGAESLGWSGDTTIVFAHAVAAFAPAAAAGGPVHSIQNAAWQGS